MLPRFTMLAAVLSAVAITNNPGTPTSGFSIVDFLPAGLEYLGCVNIDNRAGSAEEYPGLGRSDDIEDVIAENVSTDEAVDTVTVLQGAFGTLRLFAELSEYALCTGEITVADTIRDGRDLTSAAPAAFPS